MIDVSQFNSENQEQVQSQKKPCSLAKKGVLRATGNNSMGVKDTTETMYFAGGQYQRCLKDITEIAQILPIVGSRRWKL